MKSDKGGFAKGALWGAITGAVVGLLFAPRSGKETRKIIKDKAEDYSQKGRDLVEKGAEGAKEMVKKGQDYLKGEEGTKK